MEPNETLNFLHTPDLIIAEGTSSLHYETDGPKDPKPLPIFRISLHLICLFGIALNLRICFGKRQKKDRHTTTTNTCVTLLKVMAIADTISLFSLTLLLSTQFLGINDKVLMHIICKVDLFLMHTASAFSIWCWLVISAVRYIAIYRPYSHLAIRKEPITAVILILILCGVLESWILYGTGFQHNVCTTMPENISDEWASRLHIIEIFWSYVLPCILITILDIRVLCFQSKASVPLRPSTSFLNSPQQMERLRSASDCVLRKLNITNDLPSCDGTLHSTASSPQASFKKSKNLLHTIKSFKTVSNFQKVDIPIKISHSNTNSCLELSITENPAYLEVEENSVSKEEKERKISNSGGRYDNLLGIRKTNSYENLRKHSRRTSNQLRVLRRCLFITLLDLSMNLPNYLFRFYLNVISNEEFENLIKKYQWIVNGVEDITQFLYFAQFSLNALYLVYLVYDPPKKKSMV